MTHSFHVDRIEEGIAVLVLAGGDTRLEVPVALLPQVAEGQWLTLTFEPDPGKDEATREHARALRGKLARHDDGGDLAL